MQNLNYYLRNLNKYAVFSGRTGRAEYWYYTLFNVIILIGWSIIDVIIGLHSLGIKDIYLWVVLIPSIAISVRRMHDVGESGWFCIVPIYNLILALTKGDSGSNEYGPDPDNPESD